MNEKNLIPGAHKFTLEEQSAGGIASGKARGLRTYVKKKIKEHPELIDAIIDMLTKKILDEGDLKALEIFIDLAGESPRQQEISLKKQELKLKKENAENQSW